MNGCNMNNHNTPTRSSTNVGYMTQYCQNIIIDYVYGNNGVSYTEAKNAEAYLLKHCVNPGVRLDLDRI